ncbi:YbaN family protein [Idiomarina sp. HP20-50]|uniref:YbaN family protein n=1 Tax=Idiomarina sp. HP20-50 TaxID=3070813 RepID=UPI00294B3D80|nr:YbaN family protein [Idiomarina sp. HP20-50]MDV6316315.1 YbaN family protein [Idiomarina sp. HP20-50]
MTRELLVRLVWRTVALFFVLLGLIGIALPVMPTVPFLIAALWAASKGWPRLEAWLINHPKYGPDIRAWRDNRVIKRRSKVIALIMMATGYLVLWLLVPQVPAWLKGLVGIVLMTVGYWLATRPEFAPENNGNSL